MNFGTIQVANIFVGTLNAIEAYFGTEKIWGKSEPAPTANWLCFTAEEDNSTLRLNKFGSPYDISLETSTDGNTWTDYSWTKNTGDILTLANIGDKVYMRAKNENQTIAISYSKYYKFVMTGKIAASGNIQTLLKADGSRTDAPDNCYNGMFKGCASLTTAPELPATTLDDRCYMNMFQNCTSLTQAPELPATSLWSECYQSMFSGCTSLTTAPELPVTTLEYRCYSGMFQGCSSLTTAPELPATTLANNCYMNMFQNCTSLTQAPELPATSLWSECYEGMFKGCASLTTAPELPATELADNCYSHMFNGCSSLTTAPELPATTLARSCYGGMFSGCSKLNTIKLGYTGNLSTTYFNNWVNGVASEGTFYYNGSDTTTGVSAIPTGWTVVKDSQELSALCFTAKADQSILRLAKIGNPDSINLQTSTDGNTWTTYNIGDEITINSGEKAYFKAVGQNNRMATGPDNYHKFEFQGEFEASGNINSLLEENEETARTMSLENREYCYANMFQGCTSLTTAPALPATTLADSCYYGMFQGCTALTSAPELPATTLSEYCYIGMFFGCSNLNTIKLGYTGNLSTTYFNNWVNGVASTGTFYYNGSDTTTGVSAIPTGWTVTPFTS